MANLFSSSGFPNDTTCKHPAKLTTNIGLFSDKKQYADRCVSCGSIVIEAPVRDVREIEVEFQEVIQEQLI